MTQSKKTHWKALTNPDYIGAYDFQPNEERTLTIKTVTRKQITGEGGKKEECTVIEWVEKCKPMICNNTNAKTITSVLGSGYIEDWQGQSIIVGVDRIKAFGDEVDALRVRKRKVVAKVLPELNFKSDKWNDAIKAVQDGKDPETFRTHFTISDASMDELKSHQAK